MIKGILDDYQKQRTASSKEFDKLKNENKKIAKRMTEVYIDKVNKDVRQVHSSQRRIIEEINKLKAGAQELVGQAQSWIELYDGLSGTLKEAGDIINWYNVLEKRARFIKDTLNERLHHIDEQMTNQPLLQQSEETEVEIKPVSKRKENEANVKNEDEEIVVVIEARKDESIQPNNTIDQTNASKEATLESNKCEELKELGDINQKGEEIELKEFGNNKTEDIKLEDTSKDSEEANKDKEDVNEGENDNKEDPIQNKTD